MRKYIIIFMLILFGVSCSLCWGEFDPTIDGWYIRNFGTDDLSWDLYERTYLGIDPTQTDELDLLFYELFRICAAPGNCGGMSVLGLALYKYGGYFGFCSPANFYEGGVGPDRTDLRDAINIFQARQFSASGIENFVDVVDQGNLNDAINAYQVAEECLAKRDYAVLCLANDLIGDAAHTLIPYRVENTGGTRIMYLWDSNHPFDEDPSDYDGTNTNNQMEITGRTTWTYRSYSSTPTDSDNAWCFCVPMSYILPKSRHPLAPDVILDAIMTLFITGTGSTVSQVTDDEGHQLYKTDADAHTYRNELESDPGKRLKGIVRWPWFGQDKMDRLDATAIGTPALTKTDSAKGEQLPEVYFMRRSIGDASSLNVTVSGKSYEATFSVAGNIIKVNSQASASAKDVIKLSKLATAAQALEIETLAPQKTFTIKQLRTGESGKEWRSIDVKELQVTRNVPVTINVIGNMEAVAVSSVDKVVSFDLDVQQRFEGKITTKKATRITTKPDQILKITPERWETLDKTELKMEAIPKLEMQESQMKRGGQR